MENTTTPIADQPDKPKGKLRWYQFSLRSLLIVVTLFGFACSWFTVKKQQADRQKAAVNVLESHGYEITYDYEHYSTEPGYDKPTPAPNWLVNLVGKDFLYEVYSVGEPISLPGCIKQQMPAFTDADMAIFEQLPKLRTIRFCNRYGNPAKITDKGLAQQEKLKFLEELNLYDTQVTDAGIRNLRNAFPNLEIKYGHVTGNPYVWPEEECINITIDIP